MSLSKNIRYTWKFYLHLLNTVPVQTKALTAGSLSYLGSIITQKVFEKQPSMNHARALKFVAFSMLLTPISHVWYKYLDTLFKEDPAASGDASKKKSSGFNTTALKKMLVDELLYDPFCIVFFFVVIGLFERKSGQEIVEKVKKEFWPTQIMSWKVWPAFQLINFMVIPSNLRILFMNFVSFFWGIFMQIKASQN